MRIVLVSREYGDLAGAGGLKDVVHGLAKELSSLGPAPTVIIPRYSFVPEGREIMSVPLQYSGSSGGAIIRELESRPVRILTVDSPEYITKKDIYNYTADDAPSPEKTGRGHDDVAMLNAILQEAAVRFLAGQETAPDVIHGHDAHTGLLGAYMEQLAPEFFSSTGLVTSIHNGGMAYQQIPGTLEETAASTGLDIPLLNRGVLERLVNPFLLASEYGLINTVSPGYARELLTGRDRYSGSLGPELKARKKTVAGIYNGLDTGYWSERASHIGGGIAANPDRPEFRRAVLELLASCRDGGAECLGELPDPDLPWVLYHGRLAYQKGVDEVLDPALRTAGGRRRFALIIYGRGDRELEEQAEELAGGGSGLFFLKGYDSRLTAPLIAASSYVLVPSRWEPCGQIDMIAQLFRVLPIVRRVGGLRKVRNRRDGYSYRPGDDRGLEKKLRKALHREEKRPAGVRRMRKRAENTIYERRSWRKVLVQGYLPLYRKAIRARNMASDS